MCVWDVCVGSVRGVCGVWDVCVGSVRGVCVGCVCGECEEVCVGSV